MKIVLTGGGTAGHVMPNMALLPYLKRDFDDIIYIGSKDGIEKKICAEHGVTFYDTDTVKLRRDALFSNAAVPFRLVNCVKSAKKLLKDISPDVVFSKGGYVALPVCLAARSLKIPVVTHESDMTLGLANRITSRFAALTLTSHSSTKAKNALCVGNPIRDELFDADGAGVAKKYGLPCKKPLLLVIGGSAGSTAMNDLIYSCLDSLLERYEIIHLTGKNAENIEKKGYFHKPYADDVFDLYAAAAVIISRAGANAVREISALGKRVLYIPLPKTASRGDQILNAKQAVSKGQGAMLEQENASKAKLLSALDYLFSCPPPKPSVDADANARIAGILANVVKSKTP